MARRRAPGSTLRAVGAAALLGLILASVAARGAGAADQVTLSVWPAGQGRIAVTPAGGSTVDCDFTTALDSEVPCSIPVPRGSNVTLVATPEPNASRADLLTPDPKFVHWSRFSCKGTGPCTFTVDANDWISGTFTPLQLEVGINGEGTVQVKRPDGSLGSLDCSPLVDPAGTVRTFGEKNCHGAFPADRPVTLVATPAVAGDQVRWGPGCEPPGSDPATATCTVTMTNIRTFARVAFGDPETVTPPDFPFQIAATLEVVPAGSGHGTVSGKGDDVDGNPWSIDCGKVCTSFLGYQTDATLKAEADPGSRFVRWDGVCSTSPTCTLSAGSIATVEALFTTPAAPFLPRLSNVNARRTRSGRSLSLMLTVDRGAQADVRLLRGTVTVTKEVVSLHTGRTSVRLRVPRGARAGSDLLSVAITADGDTKRLTRTVRIPR
jgi:hypothetical protein